MSKDKPRKKKVVVTTQKGASPPKRKASSRSTTSRKQTQELLFHRQNYILMGIGILLIIIGLALMSGGHMPSQEVWEPERIYSFRRTVLAPVIILSGLGIEIYAIFKK